MTKFRDILKDSTFEKRIDLLIDDAKNNLLRDLGKNDFIHSENIENYLDRLVPDDLKLNEDIFDKAEIFLLLYAVYLHDIGRKSNSEHHEKETYDEILENPEKYGLKNKFEAYAVAEICYGHAKESEKPIEFIRTNYGIEGLSNKPLNLQFLATLLRLADEVDNAYLRVQGIKGQDGSVRNLIRFVDFNTTRWIIEFQSEPSNWKDWRELQSIQHYTQQRLNEIKKILELKGLYYYQIWLDPKNFSTHLTPKPSDVKLEELREFIGNLLSENPCYEKEICGHNVDIYFEEKIKGQIYRKIVFVNNEIDEDSVYGYKEILKTLKSSDEIENGFIVVENATEKIINLAKSEKIDIISVRDLVQNFADFSEYLNKKIEDYEETPIFKNDCYIPLSGTFETKKDIGIVDNYFDNWLHSEEQLQLTVLGDYGTGKSTVAKRLAYNQAKKYLKNPEKERIPVLIELKNYQKSVDIESLITDLLINKYSVDIKNFKTFKNLNESGRLLLILDGFDEMASRVDPKITLGNFREFDKLISNNSKMILTCRTHYFKNQDEIHKLHEGTEIYKKIDDKGGYTIIFLNPFTEDDFITYLKKIFPKNWEKYYQTIVGTYNLRELAEKPILLELMVETLPQIKIEENEKLNHASLYDRYTKFWLQRDDWRSYLSSDDREFITEEIAFYLFINDKSEIFYEDLPELIQEKLASKTKFELEHLDQDVRTCTFLNRDDGGNYSFVHQSFMEFFVAKKFAKDINNKDTNNFKLKKLTPEIAGFLMNIIDNIETFNEFIELTRNKSFSDVSYLGGNSATILNLLGYDFSEMDMSSTVLVGANFNNAKLLKTNLNDAIMTDLDKKNKLKFFEKRINYNEKINYVQHLFEKVNFKNTNYDLNLKKELESLILHKLNNEIITDTDYMMFSENLGQFIENHSINEPLESSNDFRSLYSALKKFKFQEFEHSTERKIIPITTFVRANMKGAQLKNVKLVGTDFREANLIGANLVGTDLNEANITGSVR